MGEENKSVYKCKSNEIYVALLDLLEEWNDSYCYTADDGCAVEDAIVGLARVILSMPGASLEEMVDFLESQ